MKNNKWLITGGVILLTLTLVGVSFAFFSPVIKGNEDAGENTFNSGTMELTFKENTDNTINLENARPGDSAFKTFTVENTGTLEDMYTYNIKLTELKTTFKEKDLTYTLVEYTDDTYETPKENGLNVNGFINENTVINKDAEGIGEMYLAIKIDRPANTQKHYYKLTITFEELKDVNQNYNQGAEFSGKINVDDNAKALLYDTLQDNLFYATMMSNPSDVLKDDFGNLRYVGSTPHNYIWFNCSKYDDLTNENAEDDQHNCEKWRIIGLFKDIKTVTEDNQDKGTENLVKIVRDESIGKIKWDDNNTNNWTTATLNDKLNNETTGYISSSYSGSDGIKGITAKTKSMIEKVEWNLGGSAGNQMTVSAYYNAERGEETYNKRPTTWRGKVGLIYPSDYGYAAGNECLKTNLYNYGMSCKDNDWLFNSDCQWTLTPDSTGPYIVFHLSDYGGVYHNNAVNFEYVVRPSLYLTSKVGIKEGVGTGEAEHPYILEVAG